MTGSRSSRWRRVPTVYWYGATNATPEVVEVDVNSHRRETGSSDRFVLFNVLESVST